MTTEITNSTFYLARTPAGDTIHDEQGQAIQQLRASVNGLDPETDDVSIVEVAVDGDDWTIKELPWQTVALKLMQEEA